MSYEPTCQAVHTEEEFAAQKAFSVTLGAMTMTAPSVKEGAERPGR
jgi:hypothetical protein